MSKKKKQGDRPEDFHKETAERLLRAMYQKVIVDIYPGKDWSTFDTFECALKKKNSFMASCKKMAIVAIEETVVVNDYYAGVIKQIKKFK